MCLLYCSTGNSNSSGDSPDSPNSTDAFVMNYKKENTVSMSTVIPSWTGWVTFLLEGCSNFKGICMQMAPLICVS